MTNTMTTPSQSTPKSSSPTTTKQDAIRRIDQIAEEAMAVFGQAGSLEDELKVAQAMTDLRAALTDDVMTPIMSLMNSAIGFKTDRDPNKEDWKTKKPYVPYPVSVVRECFIESRLRGLHAVGNEWNIIASNCYMTKNGLDRLTKTYPEVVDFKTNIGIPRTMAGGAIVPCEATWTKNGSANSIKADIPIKTDDRTSVDSMVGKATRKILARAYTVLSGKTAPEGEANEDAQMLPPAPPSPSQPLFAGPTTQGSPQAPQNAPEGISEQAKAAPVPPVTGVNAQKQKAINAIAEKMTESGVGIDQVIVYLREAGLTHPESTTIEEVPTSNLLKLLSEFDKVKDKITAIEI